jgi:hypothetical protein
MVRRGQVEEHDDRQTQPRSFLWHEADLIFRHIGDDRYRVEKDRRGAYGREVSEAEMQTMISAAVT